MEEELKKLSEDLNKMSLEIEELKRNQGTLPVDINFRTKNVIENTIIDTYMTTDTIVVASSIITPASRSHKLTAGSAITLDTTTAIRDGLYPGQIIILEGTDDTNTVTINDGANTHLQANRVLGNGDTLMLIWDETNWLEIAFSNN